jgi:hypothetical protein
LIVVRAVEARVNVLWDTEVLDPTTAGLEVPETEEAAEIAVETEVFPRIPELCTMVIRLLDDREERIEIIRVVAVFMIDDELS